MEKNIKPKIYMLSFLISAGITLVLYASCGIWPFGDHSVLTGDMGRQFVTYYEYFKSVFTSRSDFLYTFSKTLGGDMPGFCSYYLNDPLLFLLFLFPGEKIGIGIEALILLQVALCGLSASVLLNNMNKPSYSSLIFSTAYAGMGFISAYQVLTLYFTNLALLPLVILAFCRYLNENRWRIRFILLTALYVFISYYFGYMLMLFLAILYIGSLIKDFGYIKRLPSILFAIITSLCLDGAVLLMTALSLRGEKNSMSADFGFYRRFTMRDFLSVLLSGNDSASQLPMVYCTMIVICFLPAFFLLRRPLRQKLAAFFVLASLYISMLINTIDAVWHGFNNPQGFPYRYAYFFSGTVIFLSYRAYLEITGQRQAGQDDPKGSGKKDTGTIVLAVSAILVFLLPVALYVMKNPYVSLKRLVISEVFIVIAAASAFLAGKKGKKKAAFAICFGAVLIEVCYSSALTYPAFNSDSSDGSLPLLSEFHEKYEAVKEPVDACRSEDDELYRIEKDFYYSPNDPMFFDYPGLSHYSSCEKAEVKHFMERMGFRDNGTYAFYNRGSTAFTDIFLGVRYFISRFDETCKPYTYVSQVGDYHVYENPYALGFAFAADERIMDLNMEADNIFECQNEISKMLGSGSSENIYRKADFEKKSSDEGIDYTIQVTDKLPLYFYFDPGDTDGVEIFVNDTDWGHYFTYTEGGILNAGVYDPGTEVKISLRPIGDRIEVSGEYFYYEDPEAIASWYESIRDKNSSSIVHMEKSSVLSYDIAVYKDDMIMMSIPYDKGWKIKVDGKKAKSEKVLGALLAIPVEKGQHHIDMQYIPEGMFPGLAISIFGLVLLVVGSIRDHKRKVA